MEQCRCSHGCGIRMDPMLEEAFIYAGKHEHAPIKDAEPENPVAVEGADGIQSPDAMIQLEKVLLEAEDAECADGIQLQEAVRQLEKAMLEAQDMLEEMEVTSSCASNEFLFTTSSEDKSPSSTGEAALSSKNDEVAAGHGNHGVTTCTQNSKTAETRLFQICDACVWNKPKFVLCKKDGPAHLRRFTYKVTVKVETITSTLLECYSEPRLEKAAAREHAAEGALWFLKHLGHT